jgi:hypothetical protein
MDPRTTLRLQPSQLSSQWISRLLRNQFDCSVHLCVNARDLFQNALGHSPGGFQVQQPQQTEFGNFVTAQPVRSPAPGCDVCFD